MLIGEAPGHREDDSGVPFVGRSGQLLDEMLTHTGLSRKDIFITNAVSCRPPNNRSPTKREMKACRYWLDQQIAEVKPTIIGLLGNVALEQVLGVKGIKRLRGRPIDHEGVTYLPMYHPSYILRGDMVDRPTAEQDLRRLRAIMEFGGIPEERALNVTVVDTWPKVKSMLEAMTGIVSFDLETTSLYPWAGHIVSHGVGTAAGEFIVPERHKDSTWSPNDLEQIIDAMTKRMDDCITVAHNGKFDQLWLHVHHQVLWPLTFDSMLAHHILDENGRHDLENLARIYFSAPEWDIPLAEKQGGSPIDKLAKYQAHDLYYTRRLYHKLKPLLAADPSIKRLFDNLVMPAANLYVQMEARGCHIDLPKMDEVEKYLHKEIAKAEKKLRKWGDINWASPKQVAELLYGKLNIKIPLRTKKDAPSTSESALKMIEHDCVKDLLAYRGHKQQLSFFIEGWRPYIHEGRIHPSFKLHGTVTGRPSCQHPNYQQVPRDSRIRSLVTAPDGWSLLEADLSQIELRIVAELSRCPSMVHAFISGIDVHWLTAMNELQRGGGGQYVEEFIRTSQLYLMRLGLPPDRTSAEAVLEVWSANKERATTYNVLELSHQAWSSRETWSRIGEQPVRFEEWIMERGLPNLAKEDVQKEVLRAVWGVSQLVSASQERKQSRLEKVKFSDALQIVSRIGPSVAEELQGKVALDRSWKEARKKAKATNFGYIYGMWWRKFQIYARDNYEIHLTEQEAQDSRINFFQMYPLEGWHQSQRRFAHEHGHVNSLDGRKRRLPLARDEYDTPERGEAYRQAINSPVQGFASDINLMILLQLRKEFPRAAVQPIITVHDSILIEVRNDYVERVTNRLEEIMRGPELFKIFEIDLTVPIEGEVKIGPWGSGISLSKWRLTK